MEASSSNLTDLSTSYVQVADRVLDNHHNQGSPMRIWDTEFSKWWFIDARGFQHPTNPHYQRGFHVEAFPSSAPTTQTAPQPAMQTSTHVEVHASSSVQSPLPYRRVLTTAPVALPTYTTTSPYNSVDHSISSVASSVQNDEIAADRSPTLRTCHTPSGMMNYVHVNKHLFTTGDSLMDHFLNSSSVHSILNNNIDPLSILSVWEKCTDETNKDLASMLLYQQVKEHLRSHQEKHQIASLSKRLDDPDTGILKTRLSELQAQFGYTKCDIILIARAQDHLQAVRLDLIYNKLFEKVGAGSTLTDVQRFDNFLILYFKQAGSSAHLHTHRPCRSRSNKLHQFPLRPLSDMRHFLLTMSGVRKADADRVALDAIERCITFSLRRIRNAKKIDAGNDDDEDDELAEEVETAGEPSPVEDNDGGSDPTSPEEALEGTFGAAFVKKSRSNKRKTSNNITANVEPATKQVSHG